MDFYDLGSGFQIAFAPRTRGQLSRYPGIFVMAGRQIFLFKRCRKKSGRPPTAGKTLDAFTTQFLHDKHVANDASLGNRFEKSYVFSCTGLPNPVFLANIQVHFVSITASLVPACFARLCPRGMFEAQKHGQPQDNRMLEG